MDILDFSKGQVWGIVPEKYELIARKFFDLNADLASTDEKKFEAYMQSGRGGEEKPYRITDGGSAIIPITGPLSKRMTFITWLMGGSTYERIAGMFRMAIEDNDVRSIILDIDSPGGVVSGTEAVGDLIFNSRGQKPIVAYANGQMASAAYWIGSAADVVFAEKTSQVGSIGVLLIHRDYSKMDEQEGIRTTYITAGKYKALGNPDEPLSKFAKEYFQEEVNYIYSIFVDTVSRNREVGTEKVLSDMADGRVFIGERAKDAGLVDNIGDFESVMEMAESMHADNNSQFYGGIQMNDKKNEIKSIDSLTAAFPELVKDLQDKAVEAARGMIASEAAKKEQERVLQLIEIQFDVKESAKLKSVIESGVSADQLKAIKGLEPEKTAGGDDELKKQMLENIEKAGAEDPGAGDQGSGEKDYETLVEETMAARNCPRLKAMQIVNRNFPKAREAYILKTNPRLAQAK